MTARGAVQTGSMKVLLVNPSDTMFEIMGGARVFVHKTEPLGLLYIAAVLEREGHDVSVIDAWAHDLSREDVERRLVDARYDVIGINTLTSSGAWVWELSGHIKRLYPDTKVVLGNIHASVYASFYLEHGRCDAVVHGEGELIMRDLMAAWRDGTPLSEVRGISYLEDGAPRKNAPGSVVQDLDWLPLPARHLVDMQSYSSRDFVTRTRDGGRYRVMLATRGCPFACTFCVVNADRNYRMRSAESIVDELQLLVEKYDAAFVEFLDPLFTVNKKRIIEVCRLIIERGIQVEWQCEGHVNTVNTEVLGWMRRAGCRNMAFGIETASPELLKAVRKGSSPDRVHKAIQWAHEAGINPHGLFIIGLPGERPEDTEATIALARSLPLDFAQFAIFVPYPGSDLYDDFVREGRLDNEATPEEKVANWRRFSAYLSFTDLEPMYVPEGWTIESLKSAQRRAIRSFYLRPRQIVREVLKFRPSNWRKYVEGVSTVFLPGLERLWPGRRPKANAVTRADAVPRPAPPQAPVSAGAKAAAVAANAPVPQPGFKAEA
jgi:anaerobic magnesium-protoporphyrin IX monomethyl ester cyclase